MQVHSTSPIVVVANRLPFCLGTDPDTGKLIRKQCAGGLVTAVAPVVVETQGLWVGWSGLHLEDENVEIPEADPNDQSPTAGLKSSQVLPVTVSKKVFSDYYNGCCNATFWPLFHSMPDRATFQADKWEPKQTVEQHTSMASSSARRQAADLLIQEQSEAVFIAERVDTIDNMWDKLSKERLPADYVMTKMVLPECGQYFITIRMEELDGVLALPVIKRNLQFRMHVSGTEVSVRKDSKLTAKSGTFGTTSEVLDVLARLKTLTIDTSDLMLSTAELLDRVRKEGCNEESFLMCQFASEQLWLVSLPPKCRCYSPMLMSAAMVWNRTSPKLYDDLYSSGFLVLPHKSRIRRLASALSVKDGLEVGTIKYLEMRVAKLTSREKLVNLAMDEVYTARAVELAGGRVYGDSKDGVTNTIFCTHISSVAGRNEDLVTMSPVSHITTEGIKGIFRKVLKALTEIRFTVVSVTTDGHRTNQSFHNSLGDDGRHPEYVRNPYSSDPDAHVYTMYDAVHLFKNMYFNLLNKKTLLCPPISNSEVRWCTMEVRWCASTPSSSSILMVMIYCPHSGSTIFVIT